MLGSKTFLPMETLLMTAAVWYMARQMLDLLFLAPRALVLLVRGLLLVRVRAESSGILLHGRVLSMLGLRRMMRAAAVAIGDVPRW